MPMSMSDYVDTRGQDSADADRPGSGAETVEAYETDGRTVFFDAENPLAWVETSATVRLRERV